MLDHGGGGFDRFCERHFSASCCWCWRCRRSTSPFRLGREIVTEWDESLYAISASEMVQSGNWIARHLLRRARLPQLEAAAECLADHARLQDVRHQSLVVAPRLGGERLADRAGAGGMGTPLFRRLRRGDGRPRARHQLRLPLRPFRAAARTPMRSSRCSCPDRGGGVGLGHRPWHSVWLGPIFAAVFLLRGMAVLMPLVLVVAVKTRRIRVSGASIGCRWRPRSRCSPRRWRRGESRAGTSTAGGSSTRFSAMTSSPAPCARSKDTTATRSTTPRFC